MFRRTVTVAAVVLGVTALAGPAAAHHPGEETFPSSTVEVAGYELGTVTVTEYEGHGKEHTFEEALLECLMDPSLTLETIGCPPH